MCVMSLEERLTLSAMRRRGAEREEALDGILESVVARLTEDWDPQRVCAARRVLGIDAPLSVAAAAARCGGSRESARRAGQRLAAQLRDRAVAIPLIEHRALGWLVERAPILVDVAVDEMVKAGLIGDRPGLVRTLRVLATAGLTCPVSLSDDGERVELAPRIAAGTAPAVAAAERLLRHGAPVALGDLHGQLEQEAIDAGSLEQLEAALLEAGAVRLLPPGIRGRRYLTSAVREPDALPVPRTLRRTLAVIGPLPWASLLAAWQRQEGLRSFVPLPVEPHVLRAWLEGLAGFCVDANQVGVDDPSRVILDRTTRVLVEVLDPFPVGIPRAEVLDRCEAAGLSRATVALALTYHPALAHAGRDLWRLRMNPARESAGELPELDVEATPGLGKRGRGTHGTRAASYTWSANGALVLRAVYTGAPSPVLHVPAAIRELIQGRSFPLWIAGAPADVPPAMLRVRGSNAWGFGPLLGAAGIGRNDPIEIHCDLVTGTAKLQPGVERSTVSK